jgi:hypothetical protein
MIRYIQPHIYAKVPVHENPECDDMCWGQVDSKKRKAAFSPEVIEKELRELLKAYNTDQNESVPHRAESIPTSR